MAIIQSGADTNLMSVNSSKQALVTLTTRSRSGVYVASSGLLSVLASAQGATAGLFWVINPIGSAKIIAIRRLDVDCVSVAAAAAVTRVTAERFTFTGTSSGAQVTPCKIDSNHSTAVGLALTASTGLTITAGATAYSFFLMGVITAAGVAEPVITSWEPLEESMIVLRAGEGLVVRQPDAGVASDPRKLVTNIVWEEY